MAKRRWWSRKYPICLRLHDLADITPSTQRDRLGSESVWSSGEETCSGQEGVGSADESNEKMKKEYVRDDELADAEVSEAEEAEGTINE